MPKYEKSFNKIINEALDYGLPELIKVEFGELNNEIIKPDEPPIEKKEDELTLRIVELLEEITLNSNISKSLICSMFNEKLAELLGHKIRADKFELGAYRDTPTYVEGYELKELKEMAKRRKRK